MEGLCLSRKVGQSLHITTEDGQFIKVTNTKLVGEQVRLNVQADETVSILRDELVNMQVDLVS